jgi:hypothetical protein
MVQFGHDFDMKLYARMRGYTKDANEVLETKRTLSTSFERSCASFGILENGFGKKC